METLEPLDLLEKLENDIEFQALGKKIREDHAKMVIEREKANKSI